MHALLLLVVVNTAGMVRRGTPTNHRTDHCRPSAMERNETRRPTDIQAALLTGGLRRLDQRPYRQGTLAFPPMLSPPIRRCRACAARALNFQAVAISGEVLLTGCFFIFFRHDKPGDLGKVLLRLHLDLRKFITPDAHDLQCKVVYR